VPTTIPESLATASPTTACPAWCDVSHTDPRVEDHIRMVDSIHRKPHLESVAVELEQAADAPHPVIVLSLFTRKKRPKGMSAGLTVDQARQTYTALSEALRLATRIESNEDAPKS
jgi:hypothetical protein